jgi:hypothetical protein
MKNPVVENGGLRHGGLQFSFCCHGGQDVRRIPASGLYAAQHCRKRRPSRFGHNPVGHSRAEPAGDGVHDRGGDRPSKAVECVPSPSRRIRALSGLQGYSDPGQVRGDQQDVAGLVGQQVPELRQADGYSAQDVHVAVGCRSSSTGSASDAGQVADGVGERSAARTFSEVAENRRDLGG